MTPYLRKFFYSRLFTLVWYVPRNVQCSIFAFSVAYMTARMALRALQ